MYLNNVPKCAVMHSFITLGDLRMTVPWFLLWELKKAEKEEESC